MLPSADIIDLYIVYVCMYIRTYIHPTTPSQTSTAKVILSGAAIDTVAAVDIPADPSVTGTMEKRVFLIRVLGRKPDSLELVVNLAEVVPWVLQSALKKKKYKTEGRGTCLSSAGYSRSSQSLPCRPWPRQEGEGSLRVRKEW